MVLSLFASYFVAMTVVPLFCAKLIKGHQADMELGRTRRRAEKLGAQRFNAWFNRKFTRMLDRYEGVLEARACCARWPRCWASRGIFILSLGLYPLIGKAYFPRTDPGQFVINVKAPSGTRLELTDQLIGQVEDIVREVVPKKDLKIIVSNIGITPGFHSILTPNSARSTAVRPSRAERRPQPSSFDYMNRVRARLRTRIAASQRLFSDRRTGGCHHQPGHARAAGHSGQRHGHADRPRHCRRRSRSRLRALPGVSDVLVPQDVDYPALKIDIDRERASELGLNAQGSHRQPDHRADFQRHDCAELLD